MAFCGGKLIGGTCMIAPEGIYHQILQHPGDGKWPVSDVAKELTSQPVPTSQNKASR